MKLNIEIDDSLRDFLEKQRLIGGYGSIDAYLQSLIQGDKDQMDDQQLYQKLILEIARSKGDVTDDDHQRVREQVAQPRLRELRAMIQAGIDQADRGEFLEYDSVEGCVQDICTEGRKLLEQRKAAS